MGAGIVFNSRSAPQSPVLGPLPPSPVIDLSRFNPEEFPMEVRFYFVIAFKRNLQTIDCTVSMDFLLKGLRRTRSNATRSRDGGRCRASSWL